ncbi:MAG: glycosyltransferase [bacterium]|nr:MAG: glycosyltransferase [bacterium]
MKRIMLVVPSLKRGGAERIVSILSTHLAVDYDVTVVIYRDPIEYEYGGELINLHSEVRKGFGKGLELLHKTWKLKKIIRQVQPEVIVSFVGNLPVILTLAGVYPSIRNNPLMYPWIERLVVRVFYRLKNIRKVIAISEGVKGILVNNFKLKHVEMIYNPVDIQAIEQMMIEPVDHGKPYIIAVGRLHPQKGFDMLIDAYHRSGISDDYDLIILGEGAERERLTEQIRSLHLENEIKLPGVVENPFKYMKNARFFVLSSRYEGFGNVLVESLACGTTVVAFDCASGPSEIIEHGSNGVLVPAGDVNALAGALRTMADDAALHDRLKGNARSSVLRFDVRNIIDRWVDRIFDE